MLDHRSLRFRALLVAAFAGLILAACGDDDGSDAAADQPNEPAAEATTGGAADEGSTDSPDSSDSSDSSGSSNDGDNQRGSATATIDGVTYTFEPTVCIAQGADENAVSGPGTADDGTAVYIDLAAGNLAVYVGTDDPFSADPDFVANNFAQGELQETVSGTTLTVQASLTESAGFDVVAEGSLEATC